MTHQILFQSDKTKKMKKISGSVKHHSTVPSRGFRLMPRDTDILKAVYEYRVLTRFHIEALLFPPGATSRCILRLRLLHDNGYLDRQEQASRPSEGRKPFLYLLTEKAAHQLAQVMDCEREDIRWKPSDNRLKQLFLDHLLDSQDIRVSVAVSARRHGFQLLRWADEAQLHRAHAPHVVPDGYFNLDMGSHIGHFFIEVDRGTVTADAVDFTRRDWEKKIRSYQEYRASGLFQARYEATAFRMLTFTTGERRLKRLQEITERVNARSRYWFTTFDRAKNADVLTDSIFNIASRGDERVSLIK